MNNNKIMDKIIEEKYLTLNEKRSKFKELYDINRKIISIIENNKNLKRDYSSLIGSKKERNEYKDVPILCFDIIIVKSKLKLFQNY
jgi:hypothetical protein